MALHLDSWLPQFLAMLLYSAYVALRCAGGYVYVLGLALRSKSLFLFSVQGDLSEPWVKFLNFKSVRCVLLVLRGRVVVLTVFGTNYADNFPLLALFLRHKISLRREFGPTIKLTDH